MASGISSDVSIPLNDRAVSVSKRMALSTSGVGRYSLDTMINEEVQGATTKAADTFNRNKQAQQVIDSSSMGSAPKPEQEGSISVKA
ncbi:MAG: hypothetical protein HW380_482 [Magnetococcales bacterium]|nr:hypothetical protein [Magnetococcales bacterium]HIJ85320.1 hypothetical protein [Magnetococcales bacterium]